jgi:hypothetical protein
MPQKVHSVEKDIEGNTLVNNVYHMFREAPSFNNDLIGNDLSYKNLALKYNSKNFACDEFKTNHDGSHILFSGCSITFGEGLSNEDTWAHQTYLKINDAVECSGYFNIAQSGTGIIEIVANLFKYFRLYGNPDHIFLNLPEQARSINYLTIDSETITFDGYARKFYDPEDFENILLLNYQYYFMLEQYCNSNNIKLYSFSWNTEALRGEKYEPVNFKKLFCDILDESQSKDIFNGTNYIFPIYNFKSFYLYDYKTFVNDISLIEYNYRGDKALSLVSADGIHPGVCYHIAWSNFIYSIYKKVNDVI